MRWLDLDIQSMINKMHSGDIEVIISCVDSEKSILAMNALMAGTKMMVRDVRFLSGVKKAKKSEVVLLGIPLKKVAIAAEHLLGIQEYWGNDQVILDMISSRFGV